MDKTSEVDIGQQDPMEPTRDSEEEKLEDKAKSSKEMDVHQSLESSKEKDEQRKGSIIQDQFK